jgi:hypothetical protein
VSKTLQAQSICSYFYAFSCTTSWTHRHADRRVVIGFRRFITDQIPVTK